MEGVKDPDNASQISSIMLDKVINFLTVSWLSFLLVHIAGSSF